MTDADRLVRLEESLTFLQRHVQEQDREILALAETLARLRAEIGALEARLDSGPATPPRPPADERPPHY